MAYSFGCRKTSLRLKKALIASGSYASLPLVASGPSDSADNFFGMLFPFSSFSP